MTIRIKIDPEFADRIPPLSSEESALLEASLRAEGCRDPLVVWGETLVDGHHRHAICAEHKITYKTVQHRFESREAAMDWIDANQLGRRNLPPDAASVLRGRRYNRTKKAHGGQLPRKGMAQSEPSLSTADVLAKTHGVSSATIKRDGKRAEFVATLPKQTQRDILSGKTTIAKEMQTVRKQEVRASLESITIKEAKAVNGVYDVLVVDPPWPMQKIERDERPNQVLKDYPTMTEPELAALSLPCADDCHVWVWTTQRFLPMAFRLLEVWGLAYVCTFVWHKPGGFQAVKLPQYNCEFALYARRGTPVFLDTKAFSTCFEAPRTGHSEKPELFYEVVRRVTAGRRLDMFNRREIDGFDTWGKEAK